MPQPVKALDRARMLEMLRSARPFDVVVIGAGATGLGVAVDAASRGLKTLVVDAQDFAAGTSSRSTKLIHGGVRYMKNIRNWSLVREALAERRILLKNAPALAHPQAFVLPCYSATDLVFYGLGLTLYTLLGIGGGLLGPVKLLGAVDTLCELPGVKRKALKGGVKYFDAQFDDARTAVALMQTALGCGAAVLNYASVAEAELKDGRVDSVTVKDNETGETFHVRGRVFFNCTGPWVDNIRRLADPEVDSLVRISRGSHIVVGREFMPAKSAMLIPKTADGRVLFCIPWKGNVEIGTTDLEQGQAPFDPQITDDETDFLIAGANRYLAKPIEKKDVKASFSGLRPLFKGNVVSGGPSSARLSREHAVIPEFGNMITVTGGKWTSYRLMAEHAIEAAQKMGLLPKSGCTTRSLPLAVDMTVDVKGLESRLDAEKLTAELKREAADYAAYCVKTNGARTANDVLYRRLRIGQMNARVTKLLTPVVEKAVAETLAAL